MFRPAAVYVDRILRGERPADLPVQTPTPAPGRQIGPTPTLYPLGINLRSGRVEAR
jgi:hypothetical protein